MQRKLPMIPLLMRKDRMLQERRIRKQHLQMTRSRRGQKQMSKLKTSPKGRAAKVKVRFRKQWCVQFGSKIWIVFKGAKSFNSNVDGMYSSWVFSGSIFTFSILSSRSRCLCNFSYNMVSPSGILVIFLQLISTELELPIDFSVFYGFKSIVRYFYNKIPFFC